MRTIPEIVAQMRELIEELEEHTGKPAPKQEIPGLDFSLYNHDYNMNSGAGVDTISLTGFGAQPTLYDLKPLSPSDLSFTTKS
jgi:hypothetical protein